MSTGDTDSVTQNKPKMKGVTAKANKHVDAPVPSPGGGTSAKPSVSDNQPAPESLPDPTQEEAQRKYSHGPIVHTWMGRSVKGSHVGDAGHQHRAFMRGRLVAKDLRLLTLEVFIRS